MTNNKILLAAGAVALSTSLFSAATTAATVTAAGSSTVLTPLSIVLGGTAMNFGDVAGDADIATTVDLTVLGATNSTDGASAAGTSSAGAFTVNGEGTLAYSISLPTNLDGITLVGPGAAMTVTDFIDSNAGASSIVAGSDSFKVGATLTINTGQTAGAYTGNYDVTVNYQ